MKNPLWFVFWLFVFLFASFPVALAGALCYIFTYLLLKCCNCFRSSADFFLKCAQFPGYCFVAMLSCQSLC